MYLKQLEVQGYKSFANKVEFVFDEGITVVVGPNGSGKSNVADAIRWVLGEQSYSQLRGKKTEDMIFSGSDGRARLGMASATLILDNADKWLPLDFSEVTISRRAYRSGENQYYLNGSRVRLKDISELMAKSGLSRQTYTVIGQGTIDRVLSLHALDRRQLFEEAAGITFQRKKRADALDKLEKTQANLLRLNDIAKEIEPRLRRLEKQAARADEYLLIKSHLDGLLRVWYGYKWGQSQIALREATVRLDESGAVVKEQRAGLLKQNQEIGALRTEQTEVRATLSLWYAENNQLNKQAEALQRELAVNEERARQYAAQRAEILAELQPLTTNLEAQQRQVEKVEAELGLVDQELDQAETALHQVQVQLEAHQAHQQEVISRQATAEAQTRQLSNELAQRQARVSQLLERHQTLLAEQDTGSTEVAQLIEQQQELQEKLGQLTANLTDLNGELLVLETQKDQKRDRLTELNHTADQYKGQLAALNRQEDALKARQDVLDKLRSDLSGYFAGVRAVLQPDSDLPGVVGPLSQLIQVPPDLEVALETTLGGRWQDVVVETFADANAAITHLKKQRAGRATFLPLDTIRVGRAAKVPDIPGVVGLASKLVTVAEERLRPIAEFTLNRTVVVDDLPAARRAFAMMQGSFQIVTRDGELMRSGGAVTGGRQEGKRAQEGTFLAREREWRELPAQLAEVANKHAENSSQLADCHDKLGVVTKERQALVDQYQQKDEQRREIQSVADNVDRTLEQLTANIAWQQELLTKVRVELDRIDEHQVATEAEIVQLARARQEAEEQVRRLAGEAQSLSAHNLLAEESQAKSKVETISSRQKSQQALLASHQTTRQQLQAQIESKQARAQALATAGEALLANRQDLHSRSGQFESQLGKFVGKIQAAEKQLAELEARQLQLEHDESGMHQRLQRLELEHNRASLEAARCQDELDNLQRHIHEDLGLVNLEMSLEQVGQPVLPIRPVVTDLPPVEELPPGVEEDVKRLKVQMRRLGSINPEAPREYKELQERHTFLTDQINDLEAAVVGLREVISKLNQSMEEAFTAIFQQVATKFQHYFKALFGGGAAQLLLTDPHNLIDTGVDIVARPPGKRLQSLALLSGGERSLTAQALIFALLETSPTPFVVFDEVDAMLDEANVARFREALVNLARDIQFIIITHNRKTIEVSNTIYGISMGDDSVSQVYSLKIDDWIEDKGRGKAKAKAKAKTE